MKFFVDTADIDAIRDLAQLGIVDGVTTNPSLIMKSGRDIKEVTKEICDLVSRAVSAETVALDAEGMIAEGKELAKIADNITIKVPLTWEGLKACKVLTGEGHGQRDALLLGQPGASGGQGGGDLHLALHRSPRRHQPRRDGPDRGDPHDLRQLFLRHRDPRRLHPVCQPHERGRADRRGCGHRTACRDQGDGNHVLTDKGLEAFLKDWEKTGQKIL
jgi:transaldolase